MMNRNSTSAAARSSAHPATIIIWCQYLLAKPAEICLILPSHRVTARAETQGEDPIVPAWTVQCALGRLGHGARRITSTSPAIHFEASPVIASDSEPAIKIVRTRPRIEELATNNFSLDLATICGTAKNAHHFLLAAYASAVLD
jgi:hypothetical protein